MYRISLLANIDFLHSLAIHCEHPTITSLLRELRYNLLSLNICFEESHMYAGVS